MPERRIEVFDGEVGVLEISQQGQIEDQTATQQHTGRLGRQAFTDNEVDAQTAQEQAKIGDVPVAIEHHRGEDQNPLSQVAVSHPCREIVGGQGGREEAKKKKLRSKKHWRISEIRRGRATEVR